MTDIVERLRDMQQYGVNLTDPQRTLSGQSADEIERLRALIAECDREGELDHAEIERLRAENRALSTDKEAISDTASDYLHEIERLQAALETSRELRALEHQQNENSGKSV